MCFAIKSDLFETQYYQSIGDGVVPTSSAVLSDILNICKDF